MLRVFIAFLCNNATGFLNSPTNKIYMYETQTFAQTNHDGPCKLFKP